MNPTDALLQRLTPAVMVPRFEDFQPLEGVGHRFLVAHDGLWLEVRRAWLYARQRIAAQEQVAMPFGVVEPAVHFLCPPVPMDLVQRFAALARQECQNEAAAWIVWNEASNQFAFHNVKVMAASMGHIRYERPALAEGEHLVMDWHSHASDAAFFSRTDNKDDKGEVKVAGCLGHCDKDRVDMALRLCLLGIYLRLDAQVTSAGVLLAPSGPSPQLGENEWSTSFSHNS